MASDQPVPRYVNPYQPETLVSYVAHVAVLARFKTYSAFVVNHRGGWRSVGGLHSVLDRPSRQVIELVERAVNITGPSGDAGTPEGKERWFLLTHFDSVADPTRPAPTAHRRTGERTARQPTSASVAGAGVDPDGQLPSRYFLELANSGPARSKPEVLIRGLAMRSYLGERQGLFRGDSPSYESRPPLPIHELRNAGDILREVISDLAIVAGEPPTSGGLEAARLLAEAGTSAIDEVRRHVFAGSPTSWRLVRVVSEVLRLSGGWSGGQGLRRQSAAIEACDTLLKEIDENNPPCAYRARSLWEEAVGMLPKRGNQHAWAHGALKDRALVGATGKSDESPLPIRERITAGWTLLWRSSRAVGSEGPVAARPWSPRSLGSLSLALESHPKVRDELHGFAGELQALGSVDRGLEYAGEFLQAALSCDYFWVPYEDNELIRAKENKFRRGAKWWSEVDEARLVAAAIANLRWDRGFGTSDPLRSPIHEVSLGALLTQALLTIDGVSRRECLSTIQHAGLEMMATEAFRRVIDLARAKDVVRYRWLVENATFGLGWMMYPSGTIPTLVDLASDGQLDESIRMTALMSLGDMAERFRSDDAQSTAVRKCAQNVVVDGLKNYRTHATAPTGFNPKAMLRSGLYVLGMVRSAEDRQLLDGVALSPKFPDGDEGDITTPAFAQWGLDRIDIREIVQERWKVFVRPGSTTPALWTDRVEHQSFPDVTLRRLVDPMASIAVLRRRRAQAGLG